MTEPTLFDQTEPTVLAELERVVKGKIMYQLQSLTFQSRYVEGYNTAIQDVLNEIAKLKPTEIDQLKQAFAEGGAIPQSAESWVRKFSQGNC